MMVDFLSSKRDHFSLELPQDGLPVFSELQRDQIPVLHIHMLHQFVRQGNPLIRLYLQDKKSFTYFQNSAWHCDFTPLVRLVPILLRGNV